MKKTTILASSFLALSVIFGTGCFDKEEDAINVNPSEEKDTVYVNTCEEKVLSLQPAAKEGVDATIWSSMPENNSGNSTDLGPMTWTFNALKLPAGTRRNLIKFDLSSIPSNATVTDANLYLYFNPSSTDMPNATAHRPASGSNETVLQKVTESWEEMTVTWDNQPSVATENQVFVDSSSTAEDYKIDVKSLVEGMVKNPESNYGFMYSLVTEEYYRAMIFASSDHADSTLHPKLVVNYKVN